MAFGARRSAVVAKRSLLLSRELMVGLSITGKQRNALVFRADEPGNSFV